MDRSCSSQQCCIREGQRDDREKGRESSTVNITVRSGHSPGAGTARLVEAMDPTMYCAPNLPERERERERKREPERHHKPRYSEFK